MIALQMLRNFFWGGGGRYLSDGNVRPLLQRQARSCGCLAIFCSFSDLEYS